ncbi:MAG: hypothetical protein IPN81_11310 [Nitrosomonadales bacterium]|nr:hypothetical protein [Nitrosomonadales bacterium]
MHHRHLFQCILTAFALVSGAAGAAESQRFEEGGVAIEFGFDQQSQAGSALVQFALATQPVAACCPIPSLLPG